jgi:hypothetical protein
MGVFDCADEIWEGAVPSRFHLCGHSLELERRDRKNFAAANEPPMMKFGPRLPAGHLRDSRAAGRNFTVKVRHELLTILVVEVASRQFPAGLVLDRWCPRVALLLPAPRTCGRVTRGYHAERCD